MPEHESLEVLRRIRSGADTNAVLNHVKDGNILLQLALVPESRFRYDFPYIAEMPAALVESDSPYLHSPIYELTFTRPSLSQQSTTSKGIALQLRIDASPFVEKSHVSEVDHLFLKPFHAAEIIDPRLNAVKPSLWTSVNTDDSLMRKLLGFYFLYEYSSFPSFHKDYFLEDMAAQRQTFCSSLLVNAVLAYACVCNFPHAAKTRAILNLPILLSRVQESCGVLEP